MFKSLTVMNDVGDSLILGLGDPYSTGLLITNIDGLGPVKGNINTESISSRDGVYVNSARMDARNIVVDMVLHQVNGKSIEDIRQMSYKLFPVKKLVRLIFETDNLIVYTEGYVESNQPNIFTKQENTRISIICPDPFFKGLQENVTAFNGIAGNFEFPFEATGISVTMGIITNYTQSNIVYKGDDTIGFLMKINLLGPVQNLSIHNTVTRKYMKIDTEKIKMITGSYPMQGDDITISTIKGEKYIKLLRDGEYYNILNCLTLDSDWLELEKGDNLIAFIADTGVENVQFRVINEVMYEGI